MVSQNVFFLQLTMKLQWKCVNDIFDLHYQIHYQNNYSIKKSYSICMDKQNGKKHFMKNRPYKTIMFYLYEKV